MNPNFKKIVTFISDLIWPPRCIACDVPAEYNGAICQNCQSEITWIDTDFQSVELEKRYFDSAKSLALHQGKFEKVVHRFKYLSDTSVAKHLGSLVAQKISRQYDLVTCVPLSKKRLLTRGFNQSALIAKFVSKEAGFEFMPSLLNRCPASVRQVGLSAKERIENVKGVFSCSNNATIEGKSILLVDDVMTTGATANECAKVLKRAGAARVDVFTLSRRLKNC